jgi:hypothetical protein
LGMMMKRNIRGMCEVVRVSVAGLFCVEYALL